METVRDSFFEILRLERDSLDALTSRLDPLEVAAAVDLVANCAEKVVLIGVGKSGLIARKIAATFSSLGTRALFMHASDALHGDLGIISDRDVTVLLSNSGTTEEILCLLPHLKNRGVPHIAIVGNRESRLAQESDVVLWTGMPREADAHNLAPTSSTICQLAVGDALAVCVAQVKGFTPDDFALNHPAGRLGKQLTLKVANLMRADAENPVIGPDDLFPEILDGLAGFQAGAVNVVDAEGKLLGLITDGDLRRILKRFPSDRWQALSAREVMTVNPISVSPEMLAIEAMRLMEERPSQISVLPVVDAEQRCVGLIRLHDIVKAGLGSASRTQRSAV